MTQTEPIRPHILNEADLLIALQTLGNQTNHQSDIVTTLLDQYVVDLDLLARLQSILSSAAQASDNHTPKAA